MSRQLAKRWITVDEYERMGEASIFRPDDRLELLEGEIFEMSPIGSHHAACVDLLARLLRVRVEDFAIVRVQNPIRLDDFSEPQPDVALLKLRDDFYRHAHPTPADVLLVIEVADSTVESDRGYKIPLYAKAGIKEAWLVNLPAERIEIYAEPAGRRVSNHQRGRTRRRGARAQHHRSGRQRLRRAGVKSPFHGFESHKRRPRIANNPAEATTSTITTFVASENTPALSFEPALASNP